MKPVLRWFFNRPPYPRGGLLCTILLMLTTPLICLSSTSQIAPHHKQKLAAQMQRSQLQQRLTRLKRDMNHTVTEQNNTNKALISTDLAITQANDSLDALAIKQQQIEKKLAQLLIQQNNLSKTVVQQRHQLAQLLGQQYAHHHASRLQLFLSGENPHHTTRDLHYLTYLSGAKIQQLHTSQANLINTESYQKEIIYNKKALAESKQAQQKQKETLEQEKKRRSITLAHLSHKLTYQRKQAENLEHDSQRLSTLVDKLTRFITQKNQRTRRKKQLEQPDLTQKTTSYLTGPSNVSASFLSLRGKLKLPVRGNVTARFGNARENGPAWKGLFIRAKEGTQVWAVATGRVIFADWLRGFGNLIIIDHGSQYMTIYGHNQALLKRPGEIVKMHEVIAKTGNSDGNEQSGLYFEMRHQGRAFDPLGWVTSR